MKAPKNSFSVNNLEITDFMKKQSDSKSKSLSSTKDINMNQQNGRIEELVDTNNKSSKEEFMIFDDFCDGLCSWRTLLKSFVDSKRMKDIYNFVKQEYARKTVYPPQNLIFNAFKLTPISKIRVVVVGQDPYFNPDQAMGLSFSVPKGITPPPSLKNIYKCIASDPEIKGFKIPSHGDLSKWAQQGVFLLNSSLTVESGKPDSHKKSGWAEFTSQVIKILNEEMDGLVFLLWGKPAQAKAKIVSRKKHHVIETSHPSPLSAHNGFLTSSSLIILIQNAFPESTHTFVRMGKK